MRRGWMLLLALGLIGCQSVKGNGDVTAETREIATFTRLAAEGALHLDVVIAPDAETELTILTDSNLLPNVDTRVDDGLLVLGTHGNIRPTDGVMVRVVVNHLESVTAEGATHVQVEGVQGTSFVATAEGASRLTLVGTIAQATLIAEGASTIEAEALAAQDATVTVEGASRANYCVNGQLAVEASGASHAHNACEAANVTQDVSGASSVE